METSADRPRLRFLGRPLDPLTMDEALATCVGWIESERRCHVVMTVNAATLMSMRRDPLLARACEEADLVLADGAAVVFAARLAGQRVPERVTGIDLMTRLLRVGHRRQWRVFLLGAERQIVERLAERLRPRLPGLVVAGLRDGYFDPADNPTIIEQIRHSGADVLFLGMPTPRKEMWAWQHRDELDTPVVIGVGGSFDVLAGKTRRAPRVVQDAGLEWAWRLAMEPRRLWKRYLVTNSQFIVAAGREIIAARLSQRRGRGAGAR